MAERIWTVPNALTIARLVATPLIPLAFVLFPQPVAEIVALTVLVLAAATDWLDGWLARRFGAGS
ncbi:MAG: CDP-alcohol phosphatidyltransferase family protein, partial [Pseudomonadota bacterium]